MDKMFVSLILIHLLSELYGNRTHFPCICSTNRVRSILATFVPYFVRSEFKLQLVLFPGLKTS